MLESWKEKYFSFVFVEVPGENHALIRFFAYAKVAN
jgi:hypothetical protein